MPKSLISLSNHHSCFRKNSIFIGLATSAREWGKILLFLVKTFFPSHVRDIYNAHNLEISLNCSAFGKYTLIPI